MAVQIQLRNDTAAGWTAANPILAIGEMGIETDTDKFKLGNGVDTWAARPYGGIVGPEGEAGATGSTGATGATGPSGVAYATSPIMYDALTQTVSLSYTALVIDGGTA